MCLPAFHILYSKCRLGLAEVRRRSLGSQVGVHGVVPDLRGADSDPRKRLMLRKLTMAVAILVIVMPIGGATSSSPGSDAGYVPTAAPVSHQWLVTPGRLLLLSIALMAIYKVERFRQRELLREQTGLDRELAASVH